jgi:hypothetical protein
VNAMAERKCALFLTTVGRTERRRLLARLPGEAADRIRALVAELDRMPFPVGEVAAEVLADEVRGLTATTSLDLDQLLALSGRLSPIWFARVLAVWPNVDRAFCLSLLDAPTAAAVKRELATLPVLPARLTEALRAEVAVLAGRETQP